MTSQEASIATCDSSPTKCSEITGIHAVDGYLLICVSAHTLSLGGLACPSPQKLAPGLRFATSGLRFLKVSFSFRRPSAAGRLLKPTSSPKYVCSMLTSGHLHSGQVRPARRSTTTSPHNEKRMRPPPKVAACLQGVTSLLFGHAGIQAAHLSHRLAGQLDVVRTMDDPVHQRISYGFVVKGVMPDVHR